MILGIEKCIQMIDRYLAREKDSSLRLINVDHPNQMNQLLERYQVKGNQFLTVSQYSKPDEKAQTEALLHDIADNEGNLFVIGFTTFWKLESETELQKRLNTLLHMNVRGHVVVFCYQCKKMLNFEDNRVNRLIYIVNDGTVAPKPEICFYNEKDLIPAGTETIYGIQNIPAIIETKAIQSLAVVTQKSKSLFPHSQFVIRQEASAFDALCRIDNITADLNEAWGSEKQWKFALQMFGTATTWRDVFKEQFHTSSNLDLMIQFLAGDNEESDWLYFIALKMLGAKNRKYLQSVLNHSDSFERVKQNVVRDILDFEPDAADYWDIYNERKELMQSLDIPEQWIIDYCKIVPVKHEKTIFYLTDSTDEENSVLFRVLEEYANCYERNELQRIFRHTNPMLSAYLNVFDFKNDLLNRYFTQYVWQKLTNRIDSEFEEMVEDQAEKREYNAILPPRASCLEKISDRLSYAYFVDAMGAEYLGYIVERCKQLELLADIQVCRAEIPTITVRNKEFLEYFSQKGIDCANVKDLDEYKHSGENDYNYSLTRLPLHLPKELEVIDRILQKAKNYLLKEQFQQIILISDHGASRLAVIREHDLTVDVNSKGTHGGRVCDYSDDIVSITKALPSDDQQYYVIANYDRFKGGRRPSVETHGGATLEEVTVPLVVLTAKPQKIEIIVETPLVESNIKNPPVIRFYTKTKLENVVVNVLGRSYLANWQDEHSFFIIMDKKTRKGTYEASIISDGNVLASGLEFRVEKAGMKTRDIL